MTDIADYLMIAFEYFADPRNFSILYLFSMAILAFGLTSLVVMLYPKRKISAERLAEKLRYYEALYSVHRSYRRH